jgi:hypothetical protein
MRLVVILILFNLIFFSCGISKKEVLLLENNYKDELVKIDSQLVKQRELNYELTLNNYQKQGSIATFESVQKVYLDRLDSLQNEIDKLNKNSSLNQNFLASNIDSLELKLANQELFLQRMLNYWSRFNSPVNKLTSILRDSLASEGQEGRRLLRAPWYRQDLRGTADRCACATRRGPPLPRPAPTTLIVTLTLRTTCSAARPGRCSPATWSTARAPATPSSVVSSARG